jgi:hypothetical protein
MASIEVSSSKDHFTKDGRPWFYLADTVWSAFTNIARDEWDQYLDLRRSQGFNALQINILPQWDGATTNYEPSPFRKLSNGRWDFFHIEDAYFDKVRSMLAAARERGIIPALALLWCDLVAGTWGNVKLPDHEMPMEAIRPYVEYVGKCVAEFDPVFLVSGDTDFKSADTLVRYQLALTTIKKTCPQALTTFHLNPPTDLPAEIVNAPELDFYMFQSGHSLPQDTPYTLARRFSTKPVKRPAVNGEPCYEGHGWGNTYGRFGALDVRRAIWQSLLSGAKAGVTYGAHGIWSWHRPGTPFGSIGFSSLPHSWSTAMRFPGAWDAGYAKWIFETFSLFDIQSVAGPVAGREEIRLAASPNGDTLVMFSPWAREVALDVDLSRHETFQVDLAERRILTPTLRHTSGGTVVSMPEVNADTLLVAHRK